MQDVSSVWSSSSSASNQQAIRGMTANDTTGSGQATDSNSTISANDFLTLLVTEMQNQDPTADTDPNEYINQLVQVNSLEQLIDINQNLSTALGTTSTTSDSRAATGHVAAVRGAAQAAQQSTSSSIAASAAGRLRTESGNLSAPANTHSADRVASALSGRSRPLTGNGSQMAFINHD